MNFAFFLSLLVLPFAEAKIAPERLQLSVTSGPAPLQVKVVGPELLLQKAKACQRLWGGFGFQVDWGDGSPNFSLGEKPNCQAWLEHTYSVPGSYAVKASVYHPGANDAPVTDWAGGASVEVLSGLASAKPDVRILSSPAGREIFWGSGFPGVKIFVQTSRKLELVAEIVSLSGKVLFRETKSVSFSGEDFLAWIAYGNGPAAGEYRKGRIDAVVRVSLLEGKKKLVETATKPFALLAKVDFRQFQLQPEEGPAPLTVEAIATVAHPDCYAYIVDWGDGSPHEKSIPSSRPKDCPLASTAQKLRHTYRRPGTYTIRWYDNAASPFEPAREGPGYMEKMVKVR